VVHVTAAVLEVQLLQSLAQQQRQLLVRTEVPGQWHHHVLRAVRVPGTAAMVVAAVLLML